jgi:hypothetical protein
MTAISHFYSTQYWFCPVIQNTARSVVETTDIYGSKELGFGVVIDDQRKLELEPFPLLLGPFSKSKSCRKSFKFSKSKKSCRKSIKFCGQLSFRS